MRYSLRVFGRTVYKRISETTTPMTDYMKPGETHDDPDPWKDVPFTQLDKLENYGERKNALARENAERIREKLLRDGEIRTDDMVKEAMEPPADPQTRLAAYYLNAGPVAATVDGLEWNTAFRLDPDDAPTFGSDAYFEAASELSIPDTNRLELVPKKVEKCYKALEEATERNDGNRVMHPEELRSIGPKLTDRAAERAFEYLAELPGVVPPKESAPAWERIDDEKATVAGETAEVEG